MYSTWKRRTQPSSAVSHTAATPNTGAAVAPPRPAETVEDKLDAVPYPHTVRKGELVIIDVAEDESRHPTPPDEAGEELKRRCSAGFLTGDFRGRKF